MFTLRQIAMSVWIASFATLATAAPEDDSFSTAMQDYDDCHYTVAFRTLAALADGGHPGAARIALLMVRFGPQLYGSQWAASPDQIDKWARVASESRSIAARRD